MKCERCKHPATGTINAGPKVYHICTECAEELYQRLLESLPTITDSTLPIGERLAIRKERARVYTEGLRK